MVGGPWRIGPQDGLVSGKVGPLDSHEPYLGEKYEPPRIPDGPTRVGPPELRSRKKWSNWDFSALLVVNLFFEFWVSQTKRLHF